jgi:hypothetical protein
MVVGCQFASPPPVSIAAMFVVVDLGKKLSLRICRYVYEVLVLNFRAPNFSGSIGITIRTKTIYIFRVAAILLFHIPQGNYLNKMSSPIT